MAALTSQQLEDICTRYVGLIGDENTAALIELFADECTVEDPVGNDPLVGRAAVHDFFASLVGAGCKAKLAGPVHAVPDAAAAAFPIELDTAGLVVQAIDVMTFDDAGRITSMTAYWRM